MIEVNGLTKRYGDLVAVNDLSFKVEKGEVLGFLGPNGAGKTTAMRILTGYLPATGGSVKIAGHDVSREPLEVKKRIGYLPETPPLYLDLTVQDYLKFVSKIKGVSRGQRKERIDWSLEKCSLTDVRHRVISNLSKGYKQRVGLAQATLHNPDVLILDEPTVGLDPRQIREIRSLIQELSGSHTVILSTHILPEVSMTCQRALVINRGRCIADGSIDELTDGKSLEEVFINLISQAESGQEPPLQAVTGTDTK